MLSGVHVGLKEMQSPDKPGNVLAGSICSSLPLLPPACVSSVTVAGRLQYEGHIQLPAAFPSQLQCWAQDSGAIESVERQDRGLLAVVTAGGMHGTPAQVREIPWKNRNYHVWNPIPCLVFRHMEMLVEL